MISIDSKTIVIICNGPSIANINWEKLNDVATMGINGSFKLWNDIGWYPTYHYFGRVHKKQWSEGIQEFLSRFTCSRVFYNDEGYEEFAAYGNLVTPIHFMLYNVSTPDINRWENPFLTDVGLALSMIAKTKGNKAAEKMVENMPNDIDNTLNVYGIFKFLTGKKENIREEDHIKKPRFVPELMLPESFDKFYYDGGMSGEVACLIAYLMGYKKIILIGCDNNFVINKDGTMRLKASYGVKDMFYGMKYNTKEDISCPICRTTKGLRNAMREWWHHLNLLISTWNMDLQVYNAAPEDNIKEFPRLDLTEVFGKDIYKSNKR